MNFSKEDRIAFQEWLKRLETRAREPRFSKWRQYTHKNAGVRQYPGWGHWNHDRLLLYFKRYNEAGKLLKGASMVLDWGSGAGYGSELLSGYADFVIGVDEDNETINYARDFHMASDRIAFMAGDIHVLSFPIIKFDGIVAIESIEHVPDVPRVIERFYNLLADNGKLIISTPNMIHANIGSFETKMMLDDYKKLLDKYFTVEVLHSSPSIWTQKEPLSYYFIGTKRNNL